MVAGALVALAFLALRPVTYTADVLLMPAGNEQGGAGQLASRLGTDLALMMGAGGGGKEKQIETILTSRALAREVEERLLAESGTSLDLQAVRRALGRDMRVTPRPQDGSVQLAVSARDAELAPRIANAAAEAVNTIAARLSANVAQRRAEFLERQVAAAGEALIQSEEQTLRFANRGVPEIEEQAKATVAAASELQRSIMEQEVKVAQLRQVAGPDNAQLRSAESELGTLRAQLRRLTSGRSANAGQLLLSLERTPELKVEARRMLRDYAKNEQLFASLTGSLAQARIEASSTLPVVGVLDPALTPAPRSPRHLGLGMAVGAFGGLFLGLTAAFALAVAGRVSEEDGSPVGEAWAELSGRFRRGAASSPSRAG